MIRNSFHLGLFLDAWGMLLQGYVGVLLEFGYLGIFQEIKIRCRNGGSRCFHFHPSKVVDTFLTPMRQLVLQTQVVFFYQKEHGCLGDVSSWCCETTSLGGGFIFLIFIPT